MDEISIRRATEQDIDALIPLYDEFHQFHVEGVPDRLRWPDPPIPTARIELIQALRTIWLRDDASIFVALAGENIVGLAEVYLRQDDPHPLIVGHRSGFLQSLIVAAPFRRRGIGELLTIAAQRWAKEEGATEMHLETWEFEAGPLHFYEHMGYRTLKRHMIVDLQ